MNVTLQVPITDLRLATVVAQSKLSNPSWPFPKLNKKPFIRRFGQVQQRTQGGIDDWAGEEYFCNSTRAIQYTDLHKQGILLGSGKIVHIQSMYKRFFSDGLFMNKIELGLREDSYKQIVKTNPQSGKLNLVSFLKHFMFLPVKVNKQETKLFKAGSLLSTLFYNSSTRHQSNNNVSNLVQDGEICLLAIFSESEKFTLPQEAKLIDTIELPGRNDALQLFGYTLHIDGYYIKAWLLLTPEKIILKNEPAYAILRNLRINLMRIHAEKETIKSILNAIRLKQIDLSNNEAGGKTISDYLKSTSETLFKKKRYKIEQQSMLNFALRSEDTVSPGNAATLQKQIRDSFTLKNIKTFIDKSTQQDKKIILFICSSPADKNLLDFGKELKAIQDMLDISVDKAYYDIQIRTGVTKGEFVQKLASIKPDILHISLHGSPVAGLYFEDAMHKAIPMDDNEWGDVIQLQSKIHKPQIIILSTCNSYKHALKAKPYCAYVTGTNSVLPDDAGIAYAKGFYTILFNDKNCNVSVCHEAGINEIKHYNPPFAPINNVNVYDIVCLL